MKRGWIVSPIDHWVVEVGELDPIVLSDLRVVTRRLKRICHCLRLPLIATRGHHFGPGCTTIGLLASSHISIHTWPEHGYLYSDIATCGEPLKRVDIGEAFHKTFGTEYFKISEVMK